MLHIYQEITLLALRDETGTVSIANLAQAPGGATAVIAATTAVTAASS